MIQVGLLGHPVGHSRSPALFEAAFAAAELAGRYDLVDAEPDRLYEVCGQLGRAGWRGFNLTIPHKVTICGWLDGLDPSAEAVGAVNCVVIEGAGRAIGYNTDVAAFRASLRDDLGFEVGGCRAVVLGAGGASRAVCAALAGAEECVVVARRFGQVGQMPERPLVVPWGPRAPLENADLLINCTPVGMSKAADDPASRTAFNALGLERLAPGALVFDLIYVPEETAFLRLAGGEKRPSANGLGMLVRQAEAAFQLWTGQPAPRGAMLAAARRS